MSAYEHETRLQKIWRVNIHRIIQGLKLANRSTADTVSRSTYQQPLEQSSRYNSSFELNSPITVTFWPRWITGQNRRGRSPWRLEACGFQQTWNIRESSSGTQNQPIAKNSNNLFGLKEPNSYGFTKPKHHKKAISTTTQSLRSETQKQNNTKNEKNNTENGNRGDNAATISPPQRRHQQMESNLWCNINKHYWNN